MKKSKFIKVMCAGLAASIFLTHSVLAYSIETNFWKERAQTARPPNSGTGPGVEPIQLASLPLTPPSLLNAQSMHDSRRDTSLAPWQTQLFPLAAVLPLNLGSIRKVSKASSAGAPTVVHIQDVHLNRDAQTHISQTIDALTQEKAIDLIALEGAFEPINFSPYRQYPSQDTIRDVAGYLFDKNLITGPMLSGISGKGKTPLFVGVDDPALYHQNVAAYKKAATLQKKFLAHITKANRRLSRKKSTTLNRKLAAFDALVERYRSNDLNLGDYLRSLSEVSLASRAEPLSRRKTQKSSPTSVGTTTTVVPANEAVSQFNNEQGLPGESRGPGFNLFVKTYLCEECSKPGSRSAIGRIRRGGLSPGRHGFWSYDTASSAGMTTTFAGATTPVRAPTGTTQAAAFFPAIETFLSAYELEVSLNFSEVETDRARLLSQLTDRMTPQEINRLTAAGLDFRAGTLSHARFYGYLKNLCRSKGIDLARYPHMARYIQYLLLSDAIDGETLFLELKTLEKQTHLDLTETEEETALIREARFLYLSDKLARFEMTKDEWVSYQALKPISGPTLDFDPVPFERFYELADARDEAMAKNLLHAVAKHRANNIVLVTGGYHASGLSRDIQGAGFNMVSFVPKITRLDDESGSAYLSVFTQEKTPLEKLLQGEKLFLSPLVNPPGLAPTVLKLATSRDNPRDPSKPINSSTLKLPLQISVLAALLWGLLLFYPGNPPVQSVGAVAITTGLYMASAFIGVFSRNGLNRQALTKDNATKSFRYAFSIGLLVGFFIYAIYLPLLGGFFPTEVFGAAAPLIKAAVDLSWGSLATLGLIVAMGELFGEKQNWKEGLKSSVLASLKIYPYNFLLWFPVFTLLWALQPEFGTGYALLHTVARVGVFIVFARVLEASAKSGAPIDPTVAFGKKTTWVDRGLKAGRWIGSAGVISSFVVTAIVLWNHPDVAGRLFLLIAQGWLVIGAAFALKIRVPFSKKRMNLSTVALGIISALFPFGVVEPSSNHSPRQEKPGKTQFFNAKSFGNSIAMGGALTMGSLFLEAPWWGFIPGLLFFVQSLLIAMATGHLIPEKNKKPLIKFLFKKIPLSLRRSFISTIRPILIFLPNVGLIPEFEHAQDLHVPALSGTAPLGARINHLLRHPIASVQYGDIAIQRSLMAKLPMVVQKWFLRHEKNHLWLGAKLHKGPRTASSLITRIFEEVLVSLLDLAPFVGAPDLAQPMMEKARLYLSPDYIRKGFKAGVFGDGNETEEDIDTIIKEFLPGQTPLKHLPIISQETTKKVLIKMESDHQVESFKARILVQILHWFISMTPQERQSIDEIVVESTGNQARAVGRAVRFIKALFPRDTQNLKALTFVSGGIPEVKKEKLKKEGVEIRSGFRDYHEAHMSLLRYRGDQATTKQKRILHVQHGSWWVLAGYSTMAFELMDQLAGLGLLRRSTAILVPTGSGGLAAALMEAFSSMDGNKPMVVPVQTDQVNSMALSVQNRKRMKNKFPAHPPEDGIVADPESLPLKILLRHGQSPLVVKTAAALKGTGRLIKETGKPLEVSAGIGMAALETGHPRLQSAEVIILIGTGGNIDDSLLQSILHGEESADSTPPSQNQAEFPKSISNDTVALTWESDSSRPSPRKMSAAPGLKYGPPTLVEGKNAPPAGLIKKLKKAGAKLTKNDLKDLEDSSFRDVSENLLAVAQKLELDPVIFNKHFHPNNVIEVEIPLHRDNGQIEIIKGWRIQHSNARGIYKGGTRFHPSVTRGMVRALATDMTWKPPFAGIPFGGGKGGIQFNPSDYSDNEREQMVRGFVRALLSKNPNAMGEYHDVPAPDLGSTSKDMGWMRDEFERIKKRKAPGVTTGMPLNAGGSEGREKATGQGLYYVLKAALKEFGTTHRVPNSPRDCTYAIIGTGNVGFQFIKVAVRDGARKIRYISDVSGVLKLKKSVYEFSDDLLSSLETHLSKNKILGGFSHSDMEWMDKDFDILKADVDILVPAAMPGLITKENAGLVKAKVILEGANGPTTPEAASILLDKNVLVLPDILANAGGVIVSYMEWRQALQQEKWGLAQVDKRLEAYMARGFRRVMRVKKDYDVDTRTAAMIVSVIRVTDALVAEDKALRKRFRKKKPYLSKTEFFYPDTVAQLNETVKNGYFQVLIQDAEQRNQDILDETAGEILGHGKSDQSNKHPQIVLVAGSVVVGKANYSYNLRETLQKRLAELPQQNRRRVKVLQLDHIQNPGDFLRLLNGGAIGLPPEQINFHERFGIQEEKPNEKMFSVHPSDILIVTGSEVLSDVILNGLKERSINPYKIFVDIEPCMKLKNNVPLTDHLVRVIRQILESYILENKLPAEAILKFKEAHERELRELYPKWGLVDKTIQVYEPYELPILKRELWPLLIPEIIRLKKELKNTPPRERRELKDIYDKIRSIVALLRPVESAPADLVINPKTVIGQFIVPENKRQPYPYLAGRALDRAIHSAWKETTTDPTLKRALKNKEPNAHHQWRSRLIKILFSRDDHWTRLIRATNITGSVGGGSESKVSSQSDIDLLLEVNSQNIAERLNPIMRQIDRQLTKKFNQLMAPHQPPIDHLLDWKFFLPIKTKSGSTSNLISNAHYPSVVVRRAVPGNRVTLSFFSLWWYTRTVSGFESLVFGGLAFMVPGIHLIGALGAFWIGTDAVETVFLWMGLTLLGIFVAGPLAVWLHFEPAKADKRRQAFLKLNLVFLRTFLVSSVLLLSSLLILNIDALSAHQNGLFFLPFIVAAALEVHAHFVNNWIFQWTEETRPTGPRLPGWLIKNWEFFHIYFNVRLGEVELAMPGHDDFYKTPKGIIKIGRNADDPNIINTTLKHLIQGDAHHAGGHAVFISPHRLEGWDLDAWQNHPHGLTPSMLLPKTLFNDPGQMKRAREALQSRVLDNKSNRKLLLKSLANLKSHKLPEVYPELSGVIIVLAPHPLFSITSLRTFDKDAPVMIQVLPTNSGVALAFHTSLLQASELYPARFQTAIQHVRSQVSSGANPDLTRDKEKSIQALHRTTKLRQLLELGRDRISLTKEQMKKDHENGLRGKNKVSPHTEMLINETKKILERVLHLSNISLISISVRESLITFLIYSNAYSEAYKALNTQNQAIEKFKGEFSWNHHNQQETAWLEKAHANNRINWASYYYRQYRKTKKIDFAMKALSFIVAEFNDLDNPKPDPEFEKIGTSEHAARLIREIHRFASNYFPPGTLFRDLKNPHLFGVDALISIVPDSNNLANAAETLRTLILANRVHVVLMAGGASLRSWPIEKLTMTLPKLNQDLVQHAIERMEMMVPNSGITLLTTEEKKAALLHSLEETLPQVTTLPSYRSLMGALLWVLAQERARHQADTNRAPNAEPFLVHINADQIVMDIPNFLARLKDALALANQSNGIVSLGLKPTRNPTDWTGFGAIEKEVKSSILDNGYMAGRFIEKPSEETARNMIEEGAWLWNTDMFVAPLAALEKAIKWAQPDLDRIYDNLVDAFSKGDHAQAKALYESIPLVIPDPRNPQSKSMVENNFNFAVMMPISMAQGPRSPPVPRYIIHSDFSWMDIGRWDLLRLSGLIKPDENGNILFDPALFQDQPSIRTRNVKNSVLVIEGASQIEAEGVEGLVIVHAANGDALIIPEKMAPDVKTIAAEFQNSNKKKILNDCTRCKLQVDRGRVGMSGVSDLQVTKKGDTLYVSKLPAPIQSPIKGKVFDLVSPLILFLGLLSTNVFDWLWVVVFAGLLWQLIKPGKEDRLATDLANDMDQLTHSPLEWRVNSSARQIHAILGNDYSLDINSLRFNRKRQKAVSKLAAGFDSGRIDHKKLARTLQWETSYQMPKNAWGLLQTIFTHDFPEQPTQNPDSLLSVVLVNESMLSALRKKKDLLKKNDHQKIRFYVPTDLGIEKALKDLGFGDDNQVVIPFDTCKSLFPIVQFNKDVVFELSQLDEFIDSMPGLKDYSSAEIILSSDLALNPDGLKKGSKLEKAKYVLIDTLTQTLKARTLTVGNLQEMARVIRLVLNQA